MTSENMPHVEILEHISSSNNYFEVLGKDLVWVEGIIVNGHKTSGRNHWIFIVCGWKREPDS